jgi:hypothetical protein
LSEVWLLNFLRSSRCTLLGIRVTHRVWNAFICKIKWFGSTRPNSPGQEALGPTWQMLPTSLAEVTGNSSSQIRRPAGMSDWKVLFLFQLLVCTCSFVLLLCVFASCESSPPTPPSRSHQTPLGPPSMAGRLAEGN